MRAVTLSVMPTSSVTSTILERGICPIGFKAAREFVQSHHRYLAAPRGCLFAIAAFERSTIVAVAIVGRPVSPNQDDGVTAEVSRLCTHNAPGNTASALLARVVRATRAMGYHRVISYVDSANQGTCFKAANFKATGCRIRERWHGRNFCIPANATATATRYELRQSTFESAVRASMARRLP